MESVLAVQEEKVRDRHVSVNGSSRPLRVVVRVSRVCVWDWVKSK